MGLRRKVLSPLFAGLLLVPIVSSASAAPSVFEGPVPRPAACAPGDRLETGIQGEVPIADRQSGRSREGYNSNLELVGQYTRAEGFEGAAYQATYEGDCAYYETAAGTETRRGVQVVDASNRSDPTVVRNLTTPAMLSPWESLKVHPGRKLLAGVMLHTNAQTAFTGFTQAGFIDIYDVGQDCANPKLLSSRPFAGLSHEGNWTPDGNTFWASSVFPGILTAVDVRDPTNPLSVGSFSTNTVIHGLGISPDGNRLYVAYINDDAYFTAVVNPRARALEDAYGTQSKRDNNGLAIWDVSEFQARKPNPQAKLISTLFWKDGQVGQHVLPITRNGTPYVVFVDEYGRGGPRIIDIRDERNPVIVSKLKTEIQMPENYDKFRDGRDYDQLIGGAVAGPTASSPPFAYNTHYCSVDRPDDPTILACSSFMSGVRIFDIRDFAAPRELAYYNPGGDGKLMPGSYGGHTSAYTTASPRIIPETGEIWFTDMDGGFFVTRFAKGVWPLAR
ncbi:MAG: hypothetical protein LC792_04155 [Actinobacteria bacterium]|nr:hypothetical protein [Actinomycetota bacterium]